jgi:dipeptidyl aminopeptidase/acylaminoacyl peptidase
VHLDLARRLLAGPVVGEPALRADGGLVALTVSAASLDADARTSYVEVLDLDGRTVWRSDGPDDRSPRFAPAGALLGFTCGVGVRVVDPESGYVATTLDAPGAVRRWAWCHDGRAVVATTAVPDERAAHDPIVADRPAYKRDGEGFTPGRSAVGLLGLDGAYHTVAGPFEATGDIAWHPAGYVLVCLPADGRRWRWDLVAFDAATGQERWRTPHDDWDRASSPVALPDGRVLYVGGPAGPEHAELVITDGASVTPIPIGLDRNVTIGAPAYPGAPPVVDGDDVLFTANDDGCSRLHRVALDGGSALAASTAGEVVTGLDARADVLVTTTATGSSPGELRLHRTVLRRHEPIELPWTVERLAVATPDGAPVPAWVLRSTVATGRAPLLLDIHGGPHNASNGALTTANLHRALLAAEGWHVLLVNPRGSDGSGIEWFRGLERHGGWASADLDDLLAAVDAAVDAGIADPDHLAVTGYSYGGLATAALTTRTDRFRAAAMGGSLVDLRAFVTSADLGPVLFGREVGGTPWAVGDLERRSPITHVGAVRTPTLVFHGTADQRSPVTQAEQWYQSLQALGVPSELVLYPGASHGFVTAGRPSWVLDVGRRIAEWVLRHG